MRPRATRRTWLHLRAWLLLAAFTVVLRLIPIRRLKRWLIRRRQGATGTPRAASQGLEEALEVGLVVSESARLVPLSTCLSRALVAHLILVRHGHPSRVEVGVKREAGLFEAHAWVTCYGRIVLGDSEEYPVGAFVHLTTINE